MRGSARTSTGPVAALALVLASIVTAPAASAAVSPATPVVINEVYGGGGNSGATWNRDFVELVNVGTEPVDVSSWAVQYASATGTGAFQVTPLAGVIPPGGYLLVGEAAGAGGTQVLPADVDGSIPMSGTGGKVALTSTVTGLPTCTGTACAAPESVVDFVGWGSANGYAGTGPAPATTNPTSVSRDTDHTNTADNAADFTAGEPSPQGSGTPDPGPDPTVVTIAEIQGTGDASPLAGRTVTTEGVVTAAYPTGGYRGFVVQAPGTGGAPGGASQAVFVYAPGGSTVAIGAHVRVTGQVSEFHGLTELTLTGIETLAEPAAPVTPVSTGWPADDAGREVLESMLVAPQGPFTVSNTYPTNQYGEVGLAAGTTPLRQPTDVGAPGSAAAAAAAADDAARGVVLDDGSSVNFLSAANSGLTPPYVSLSAPLRVGAAVTFTAPIVVDYRNDLWKLSPTAPVVAGGAAPATFADTRTDAPEPVGGDLKVATFNVLNYFTTLGAVTAGCVAYDDRTGDPVTVRGGCAPRGAWDPDDLQRQQDKIVAAINGLDADVVGLLEIENSAVVDGVSDEALGTLVGALNTAAGAGTWAYVPSSAELPPVAEMDVITNAIIYRPAAVARSGESRALGTLSGGDEAFGNAREPIAQEFVPVGGGEPFLVVVNHLKSKGSAGPWPGDVDSGDGQGASNESRVRQATALRDWVATIAAADEAVALVGDFNAYTHEDPLQVLYDAGYTDAASTLATGQYSYSFDGLSGSLDHVLLNGPALARATGADIWEINAEESIALEYSRYNYHGTLFYAADQYRSSDHDPVLVGLTAQDNTGPIDLTFLNFNDFHGRIDANTLNFAATVEQERAAAEQAGGQVAVLSAGDNIGASLFASASAQDNPTLDLLKALGVRTSSVGNHEFDKGFADLTDRVIPYLSAPTTVTTPSGPVEIPGIDTPYLGANVYLKGTTTPALPEYALFEIGGVTVGVIGAVTQQTPTLVSPAGITTLDFGNPVDAVNRVAAQLSDGDAANGEADLLVAEYHEGADTVTATSTLESEIAESPTFAAIVDETSPDVDVIFNGHTHQAYAWQAPVPGADGVTRPVVQGGNYGARVGRVTLTFDRDSGQVTSSSSAVVPRGTAPADLSAFPRLQAVKAIVDKALADAAVVGNQPVGSVTADITTAFAGGSFVDGRWTGGTRDDRASESTLGNLVANALRDTLSAPDRGGADFGVVNPGGLRAELLYAQSAVGEGDGVVTFAEANNVLPFVNNLWTTTLTGAQVRTMLEQQWQRTAAGVPIGGAGSRPYLQLGLSDNVGYTYDPDAPMDQHITSVTIDGVPLDPAATYRVGTFSFLTAGGDNFHVLAQGSSAADSGLIDRDAWIAYLQAHQGLAPDFARHAVVVADVPTSVEAGAEVAVPVSRLDLTSLGSPANTALSIQLDGTEIGTATVSDGTATATAVVPAGTPAGAHVLTLVAAPSGTTVTLPLVVEAGLPASTTTLTASPDHQVYGDLAPRVRLMARVTADVPVAGSVEFVVGDTVLGTAALRGGLAQLVLSSSVPAGSHDIVARFTGSETVAGSQSAPVTVTVEKATSWTTLRVVTSPLPRLLPSVWAATVRLDVPGFPAGTVELREGDRVLATVPVVLGIAAGTLPSDLAPGTHDLTAVFVPNDAANVQGSRSRTVTVSLRR